MTLPAVVELNNRGVRLLEQRGDIAHAIQSYQTGLLLMRTTLLRGVRHCCETTKAANLRDAMSVIHQIGSVVQTSGAGKVQKVRYSDSHKLDYAEGYSYSDSDERGHCAMNDRSFYLSHQEMDAITIACILQYNLSLAFHIVAVQSGCDVLRRHALEDYNRTLLLLYTYSLPPHTQSCLMCLTLNNMAQLYYDNCDYIASQECMTYLTHLVLHHGCLDNPHDSNRSHAIASPLLLTKYECDQIKLNVLYFQVPSTAIAA